MKTEIKVLLYIKRNGQGKDGLCPLMGRIMVKGAVNSVTQFGCKKGGPETVECHFAKVHRKEPDGRHHQQGDRQDVAPSAKEIQRTAGNQ